jgi:hypothetical protein
MATSTQSKKIFALTVNESEQSVKGFQTLFDKVIDAKWHSSGKIICLVRCMALIFPLP